MSTTSWHVLHRWSACLLLPVVLHDHLDRGTDFLGVGHGPLGEVLLRLEHLGEERVLLRLSGVDLVDRFDLRLQDVVGRLEDFTPCFFSNSSTALLSASTLTAVIRMISAREANLTIAWRSFGSSSHLALLITTSWYEAGSRRSGM